MAPPRSGLSLQSSLKNLSLGKGHGDQGTLVQDPHKTWAKDAEWWGQDERATSQTLKKGTTLLGASSVRSPSSER